jgi:hypothetical protein
MIKKIFLCAAAALSFCANQAQAVTINFETTDNGAATVSGNTIGAADFDAFGAILSGATYFQCGVAGVAHVGNIGPSAWQQHLA